MVNATFEWFAGLYVRLFGHWLHIHFLIRTVLLLLVLWLIIYVAAQLFQYVIAPVVLILHGYATNRPMLANSKYADMVRRSKGATLKLMVIAGVVSTLWTTAFGLHHEYAAPAALVVETTDEATKFYYAADDIISNGTHKDATDALSLAEAVETFGINEPYELAEYEGLNPALWPADADIVFYLNEEGAEETRLRSGPGIAGYSVIEILWDNDLLVYLHHFYPDAEEFGLFWLQVLTPRGTVGYVSSRLVGKVEGL